MVVWIVRVLGLLSLLISSVAAAEDNHYYVAPAGNDNWSGLLDLPNKELTDGPLRTIQKAQAFGRLSQMRSGAGYTVTIRDGRYWVDQALELQPNDSGSPERPTLFEAYSGEHPVISGGVRLTGWKAGSDGKWKARLPDLSRSMDWTFTSLFVNGQRRYRPRWPVAGYAHVLGSAPRVRGPAAEQDQFIFSDHDIKSSWISEPVELVMFHYWTTTRASITAVDETSHLVTLDGHAWSTKPYGQMSKGRPYIVDNVREALTPGQWYLDQETREVTYWPLPGEDVASLEIIAPRFENVLKIGAAVGPATHDLQIDGLTFAHTNWTLPAHGLSSGQSEMGLPSAILVQNAVNIHLARFAVQHTGGYAIAFDKGANRSSISGCELRDLGGGGIRIGTSSRTDVASSAISPSDGTSVGEITVSDCSVSGGGRMHPASVGIWIGDAHDTEISHNEVSDFYYTAISVGWSWGYGPSRAVRNRVSYNRIFDIGKGRMSDLAGIYTLGVSPGTIIEANYISRVRAREYGGWGLYADEGTSGVRFINNIVSDVGNTGFMIHFGRNNIVSNNIFAGGGDGAIRCNVPDPSVSAVFQSNVLLLHGGTAALVDKCDRPSFEFDSNMVWSLGPEGLAPTHPGDWRYGMRPDMHSRLVDPRFVAPSKNVFSLKEGSPLKDERFGAVDALSAGPRYAFRRSGEPPVLEGFD